MVSEEVATANATSVARLATLPATAQKPVVDSIPAEEVVEDLITPSNATAVEVTVI